MLLGIVLGIFVVLEGCVSPPKESSLVAPPSEAVAGHIEELAQTDPEQSIAILSDIFEKQREKGEPLERSVIGEQALTLFETSSDNIVALFTSAVRDHDVVAASRLSFSASSLYRYASRYEQLNSLLPEELSSIGAPETRLQLIFMDAEARFQKYGLCCGQGLPIDRSCGSTGAIVALWPNDCAEEHDFPHRHPRTVELLQALGSTGRREWRYRC